MTIWCFMDSIATWPKATLDAAHTPGLGGGIGGAESMTIGLAMHLVQRGHAVTIWSTHCEPGTYAGVVWRSVESDLRHALTHEPSPDVFVSVRRPEVFSLPEFQHCTARRVLWAQDRLHPGDRPNLPNIEAFIYVSHWQQQQWEIACPELKVRPALVTPVAMDPDWIQTPAPRDVRRYTYIYASRPERGLEPLLRMWPTIRQAMPKAHLIITGYTQGVDVDRADALVAGLEGIEIARSDDKFGLFRQLARASLLLYPGQTWFEETNGSICSQAMAAGVLPFTSDRGALSETIPSGVGELFQGDPRSPTYQDHFIVQMCLYSDPAADPTVARQQAYAKAHVLPACSYQAVTDLWEQALSSQEIHA